MPAVNKSRDRDDPEERKPLPVQRSSALTPRQLRFIHEYMVDRDAVRAAEVAGYPHPETMGHNLLDVNRSPQVAVTIRRLEREIAEKLAVSADKVLRELAAVGFFNPRDLLREDGSIMPLHEMPAHLACAIQSMDITEVPMMEGGERKRPKKGKRRKGDDEDHGEPQMVVARRVEVKFYNKLESLSMLAKHLGLFRDMNTTNVIVGVPSWDDLLGPPRQGNTVNDRVQRLLESAEKGAQGDNGSADNAPKGHTQPPPLLEGNGEADEDHGSNGKSNGRKRK